MRSRPLMPVFLALLMLLGPFGHVIPTIDSTEGVKQDEGLGSAFDDLTLEQQQALENIPETRS